MLVLTRKVGEEIIIDGGITVSVTMIKGDKVRIGITAPPHLRVDRAEVVQRMREFAELNEVPTPQPQDLDCELPRAAAIRPDWSQRRLRRLVRN